MKRLTLFLAVSFFCGAVFSETIFPSADGDEANASPANIEGELIEATPSVLVIAEKGGTRKIKIKLTEKTKYFTAFGGFVRADELLPGQVVWIWYDDYDSSKEIAPKAKVVKVFSLDPNDKP